MPIPMFAWFLVAAIVSVVISIASAVFMLISMGKAKKTVESKPLEMPSTEVGKTIPVLFGTEIITDASIANWGDVKILKVKVGSKGKK